MDTVRWLNDQEAAAWKAVRDLGQPLWSALGRDLQRDSGLSMADYQVLVVLSEIPEGVLSYRELTNATGWEKSRLSHHITRMEKRNLVARQDCVTDGRSADIALTSAGRSAIETAAPGHVAAVRKYLIDLLEPQELTTLISIARRVNEATSADGPPAPTTE